MKTLSFFIKYGWLPLLAICLFSFVPLAIHADMVGGIPSWAYWGVAMVLTLVLILWFVIGTIYNLYRLLKSEGGGIKKNAPHTSKYKGGHGGIVVVI